MSWTRSVLLELLLNSTHPARTPPLRQQQSGNMRVNVDFLKLRALKHGRSGQRGRRALLVPPWQERATVCLSEPARFCSARSRPKSRYERSEAGQLNQGGDDPGARTKATAMDIASLAEKDCAESKQSGHAALDRKRLTE